MGRVCFPGISGHRAVDSCEDRFHLKAAVNTVYAHKRALKEIKIIGLLVD
jgi:hypothetical protein